MPGHVAIVDGVLAETVSVWDAGFTLGDGIFETIAVRDGRLIAADAHFDRLERAAAALGFQRPGKDVWLRDFETLCAAAPSAARGEVVLRLQITSGPYGQSSTRVLMLRPVGARELTRRGGLHLHVIRNSRGIEGGLGTFKTTSWIVSAVARRTHPAGADPAFEGLFVSESGEVLEGTSTAIVARFSSTLVLPPLDGRILESTVRARLIRVAESAGLRVEVKPLSLARLSAADDVLALNALLPVAQCHTLDGASLRQSDLAAGLCVLLAGD